MTRVTTRKFLVPGWSAIPGPNWIILHVKGHGQAYAREIDVAEWHGPRGFSTWGLSQQRFFPDSESSGFEGLFETKRMETMFELFTFSENAGTFTLMFWDRASRPLRRVLACAQGVTPGRIVTHVMN